MSLNIKVEEVFEIQNMGVILALKTEKDHIFYPNDMLITKQGEKIRILSILGLPKISQTRHGVKVDCSVQKARSLTGQTVTIQSFKENE